MLEFGIIGAGIVGWSVATILRKEYSGAKITVIADKFDDETTSWGAAGSFRVEDLNAVSSDRHRAIQWAIDSMQHYWNLSLSDKSAESGVFQLPMFQVYEKKPEKPPDYLNLVHCVKTLSNEELHPRFPRHITFGYSFITTLTESKYYIPWLRHNFLSLPNGHVEQLHIKKLDQLKERNFRIIFNCSGIGAQKIVNDLSVYPVRGQVFKVLAPWIKHAVYASGDIYMYPGRDSVTVGGVRQKHNYDTSINSKDSEHIMTKAVKTIPSLTNCKVLYEWTGLRPGREGGIRVELEDMSVGQVIHCYGHGGNGVALSWGTAKDAVSIAKQVLGNSKSRL